MSDGRQSLKDEQRPGIELEAVKVIQLSIEGFLQGQEKTEKLPRYANTKLLKLIELSVSLDSLANLRDGISGEERLRRTMHALMEAYLHNYVDGRTKSWGHTKKSPALEFTESILESFKLIIPSEGKKEKSKEKTKVKDTVDARTFRTFAASPELLEGAVNSLFTRAMADGVSANNPGVYVNISKGVTRMGDAAIQKWNAKLSALFKDLPSTELNKFKISLDPEKQDDSDHGKSFSALYGNAQARKIVNDSYYLEFLTSLIKVEIYKSKTLLAGELKPHDRIQIVHESNSLEALLKKLENIHEDKADPKYSDAIHRSVMETYIHAYISERAKGGGLLGTGTLKGPFLLRMEELIKNFNQKTGSEMFVGADKKRPDSTILSSVDSKSVSPETRKYLVEQVIFNRAMQQVFNQKGEDAQTLVKQAEIVYVNCVKAIIRMGEAAVDDWNNQAVTMNAGEKNDYPEIVPFPDLVINDINQDEEAIVVNFQALSENEDLIKFVSTGVFQGQRQFNEEQKEEEYVIVPRHEM